jgi:nucleoid DNA-binding protein
MKKSEEILNLFTDLMLFDKRRPTRKTVVRNQEYEIFDIPALEACSKNKNKESYTAGHLAEDLAWFFKYLPKTECVRIVRVLLWLLTEALKNYGFITLSEFGSFFVYDKPSPIRYDINTNNVFTTRRMKLKRTILFKPSSKLNLKISPRDIIHNRIDSSKSVDIPSLFESFVYEKRHRKQGKILCQTVFDLEFKYLGYSDEYIKALMNKEILVK